MPPSHFFLLPESVPRYRKPSSFSPLSEGGVYAFPFQFVTLLLEKGVFIPRKDLSPRRSLASERNFPSRPPPAFNQIPEIKDGGSVGGAVCALDSVRKGGGVSRCRAE